MLLTITQYGAGILSKMRSKKNTPPGKYMLLNLSDNMVREAEPECLAFPMARKSLDVPLIPAGNQV
jgi:hypothetical protein